MEKIKNYVLGFMERIPLEDGDIYELLGNDQKIIIYADLKKYIDITQLLPKNNDSVIILYEQQKNTGHWCCLKKMNNIIYYFNSYGGEIDEPLKYSKDNNLLLGQNKPYLKNLLIKCNNDVYYNKYSFQNPNNPEISTCGLWCIGFIKSNLNLNDFYKLIMYLKKKYKLSNDKLITNFIISKFIK